MELWGLEKSRKKERMSQGFVLGFGVRLVERVRFRALN